MQIQIMYNLKDKVAIVTGGARGIGKGTAKTLAECGCKIAILDIEDAAGKETVQELSLITDSIYVHCDISVVANIKESFQKVLDHFGLVHILINNAAIPVRNFIKDIDEAKWDTYNDINTKSVFFFSQIFAEQVKEKNPGYGRIINLSSIRAAITDNFHAGYCITKSAVNSITKTFAVSYGPYGITTNAVALGFVATPMTAHYFDDPGAQAMIKKLSPIGRAVEIEDVANTIAFLVSENAGAISGQILTLDGGGTCSDGMYA